MQTTRRGVLKAGLGVVPASLLALGPGVGAAESDRKLVVVELMGGNDGLNTVVPFGEDAYYRARPSLGLRENLLDLDGRFALHPSLAAVGRLYREGKVAIVHGCGYPNASRSHYRSREVWRTGRLGEAGCGDGWLGLSADPRVVEVRIEDFDTHTGQLERHVELLRELDSLIASLQRPGVVTLVVSEFGRRVAENSCGGTDHGAAGPVFVIGDGVKGGMYGVMPSLTDLDDGDLRYTTDFRRVYATVLERWLGLESAAVLGARFEPLPLL